MNLCLFQGTFNPVHNGHLDMALYAVKKLSMDKIIFIPAFIPPHKDCEQELSLHRLEMLELATSNHDFFEIDDSEYKLGGTSYTYLTILHLRNKFKTESKFNFIIGSDAFLAIESWYEADKLKNLLNFIVFPRENMLKSNKFLHLKEKGYNYVVADKPFLDVSSSTIRKMIAKNTDVSGFLDEKVLGYIIENGIYIRPCT